MILIQKVTTKKQQRDFIDFPIRLYKGNKYYVPMLYMDEKALFTNKNAYIDQCDSIFFLAYDGKKVVGRIQGILQKASNEKWKQKRVRFTRFDCIDNQEVANKLFDAIFEYAKGVEMTEVVGPLGYSDLEREGLLIEGFDKVSTYEEQYNYPYYQKLIENYGFQKDVDWTERELRVLKNNNDRNERIFKIASLCLKKYNLHIPTYKNINEFIKRYGDQFFEILDDTYVDIYGTVPFTERMKKQIIGNFKLIVNQDYVRVIVDENDKVVCFGLCIPSISKALIGTSGKLTPKVIFGILRCIKKPDVIDFALVGVRKKYAMKGVSPILISEFMDIISKVEHVETNLNLEDNIRIQNQWKNFDSVLHKRRRCFIKKV